MTRLRQDVDERFETWYHEIFEVADGLVTTGCLLCSLKFPIQARRHNWLRQLVKYFKNQSQYHSLMVWIKKLRKRFLEETIGTYSALMRVVISTKSSNFLQPTRKTYLVTKVWKRNLKFTAAASMTWNTDRYQILSSKLWRIALSGAFYIIYYCKFLNIYILLQIGCLLSVTSCEAERSFSAVGRNNDCTSINNERRTRSISGAHELQQV